MDIIEKNTDQQNQRTNENINQPVISVEPKPSLSVEYVQTEPKLLTPKSVLFDPDLMVFSGGKPTVCGLCCLCCLSIGRCVVCCIGLSSLCCPKY